MVLWQEKLPTVVDVDEVRTMEPVSNVPAMVVMNSIGTVAEQMERSARSRRSGGPVEEFKLGLNIDK